MYRLITALAAVPAIFAQYGIQDGSFVNPGKWTVSGGATVMATAQSPSGLGYLQLPAGSTAAATPGGILSQGRNVVGFMLRAAAGSTGAVTMDTNWTLGGSGLQFTADNKQPNGSVLPGWRQKIMSAVTGGGHGTVSKFTVSATDGTDIDELYLFSVKPPHQSTGRFGGGTLMPNTVSYGAALYGLWETSLASPTSVANGHIVLAGYAASPAPPTMKLVFEALGEKYPSTAPGTLSPAIIVEFYNWTSKRWESHLAPSLPQSPLNQAIPISGSTLAPVTVSVAQPARFIDASQQNLMVARIRPTTNPRNCIVAYNQPPPCAPVAASLKTIFIQ